MTFTAGSLFSGIGGLDLAATMAGFDVLFHVEIDEFCRKVLAKHAPQHWPNAKQFTDVRQVGKHNLPEVEILFGGFPCQDVSLAGKRDGIREGTRSGLWFEFRRVISELRPRVVLLENVPGILTRDGTVVIADLAALGYVGRWGIISASDVGAPHQRERWFCVAYATGVRCQRHTARQEQYGAISSGKSMGNANGRRRGQHNATERGVQIVNPRRVFNREGGAQSGVCRVADGLPGWLDFPGFPARPGEDQYPYEPPRVTTIKVQDRAARLKSLGNAVVPYQVYPIFLSIYEWLQEKRKEEAA